MVGTTPTHRTTLADYAVEHFEWRGGGITKTTLASERSTVRKLCEWWDRQRRSPRSLGKAELQEFLRSPHGGLRISTRNGTAGQELRNNSYNKAIDNLKPFIEHLILHKIIDPTLLAVLLSAKRKGGGKRSYVRLSKGQIQEAVEGAPDPFERWATAFASLSMGRESELQLARMGYFNLETRKISWSRPKVDGCPDFSDGLPMFEQLIVEYERWREYYTECCPALTGAGFAVPSRRMVARGRNWVYDPSRPLERLGAVIKRNYARAIGMDIADLPGQAAHMARRSGARSTYDMMRDAGVYDPIRIVQAMLGHTQQKTTEDYIGLEGDRQYRDDIILGEGSKLFNWVDDNVIPIPLRAVQQ